MAAQTTITSMYPVRADVNPNRPSLERRDVLEAQSQGGPALLPARDIAGSSKAPAAASIAIIPGMRWEDLSDEALITKSREEAEAQQAEQYINELFRRHHVKVARWCLGFTGDRESAADLAQEICAKAYKNLPYFKGQSKFSTWLYSIARNHSLNAIRSRKSMPEMDTDETVVDTLPDMVTDNPLKTVERNQLTGIARQIVNEELDELEKQVFTLHFAEEIPLDAITRMLNLGNASGAKAYLVSAKRKLDKAVKRWKAKA